MTRRKNDKWALRLYVGLFLIGAILSLYAIWSINEYAKVMMEILKAFKQLLQARNV